MKTVGVGAVKPESDNADELKKEIKGLKSSNTKLKNKIEESLRAENATLKENA